MNANSTRNVVVDTRGTQVVAHVGLHALGSFADRPGWVRGSHRRWVGLVRGTGP